LKVIVTTGPSFEPIDEVRRLTNFSTGELGVRLANHLAASGREVFCLRGVATTHPGALENCHHVPFTTNDDLLRHLASLSGEHEIGALFHVAALCDFKVGKVANAVGQAIHAAKFDSRAGHLTIELEPARKVIGELRGLFPKASLVGWKYELNGTGDDALGKAWRQLQENRTDACVLNGRAYGSGFAFCTAPDVVQDLPDKENLIHFLSEWIGKRHPTP
jgi:phosphopantothenoylcysteine synthetase/decarboxylase